MPLGLNSCTHVVLSYFLSCSFYILTVVVLFVGLGFLNLLPLKFLNFCKTYIKAFCYLCSIIFIGVAILLKLVSGSMYTVSLTVMKVRPTPVMFYVREVHFDIFWDMFRVVSDVNIYFNSYILSFFTLFSILYPIIF